MPRLLALSAMTALTLGCSSPTSTTTTPASESVSGLADRASTRDSALLHIACAIAKDPVQQIEACTFAINSGSLPPKSLANALALRGTAYLRQSRFSEARIDFEEARSLDPSDPLIARGQALVEVGSSLSSPDDTARTQAAFDCQGLDDPKAQLAACDLYVSRTSDKPDTQATAYDARAFVKLRQRDTAGAIEDLDKAIALAPEAPEFKDHRLRAQFMHGDYRASLPGLIDLLNASPYNEALKTMIATIYYVDGRKQEALSEFDAISLWERHAGLPAARALSIRLEPPAEDDPFEALRGRPTAQWLGALVRYRMSEIAESEFRSDMATFAPENDGFDTCLIEFQVAHKAALQSDMTAARTGFEQAIKECGVGEFEYHAAKFWLKQLGG